MEVVINHRANGSVILFHSIPYLASLFLQEAAEELAILERRFKDRNKRDYEIRNQMNEAEDNGDWAKTRNKRPMHAVPRQHSQEGSGQAIKSLMALRGSVQPSFKAALEQVTQPMPPPAGKLGTDPASSLLVFLGKRFDH